MVRRDEHAALGFEGVLTTPSATRRPPRAAARTLSSPSAAPTATLAFAATAGLALGVVAALADGHGGWLSNALSLPGPWIAAAALVALAAARDARRWTTPVATAGFLVLGIAAYYVTKQAATGAVPGPLVAFWAVLAVAVGVGGGIAVSWGSARPWGVAAIVGAVAGWLVAEALLAPSAPLGEAVAGLAAIGVVGRANTNGRVTWRAASLGAGVGAAAAIGVFAVLSRALSAAL